MKKPSKHTLETLSLALKRKGLDYITPIEIKENSVTVKDEYYGDYSVDLKSFCESMDFPKHKNRRHKERMTSAATKLIGTTINGYLIQSMFYGPDKGYKNRSFYVEHSLPCGHTAISTVAYLKKHRRPETECQTCHSTIHGARGKKDGIRIKRTTTYIHWQRIRSTLPLFLQEFSDFRRILGDKPYARAEVIIDKDTARWVPLVATSDRENNLIAAALRQAFRHSDLYKETLTKAKVETDEGTRYRCEACGQLYKKAQVQIDHIEPIAPLDGRSLLREEILQRVWTDKIQVLDKICHSKKSTLENRLRKEAKIGAVKEKQKIQKD